RFEQIRHVVCDGLAARQLRLSPVEPLEARAGALRAVGRVTALAAERRVELLALARESRQRRSDRRADLAAGAGVLDAGAGGDVGGDGLGIRALDDVRGHAAPRNQNLVADD